MPALEQKCVTIPNVPKLSWKKNTQSCFIGSLSAALSVTDHPVSETELNGLTALAFRTRWLYYTDKPKWCPSCPVGECPDEIAAVGRHTGWSLEGWFEDAAGHITPAPLADVVASIDRGIPGIVYDTKWNPAIAYGYTDGGQRLIVSDYFGGDGPNDPSALPPFVLTIKGFAGAPDRKAAVTSALRMAIANWHTDHKWNGPADYWYGRSAFDHWIHDVLKTQDGPDGNPFFATWWNMDVLVDARRFASMWLADIAPVFPDTAAAHLRTASEIYDQEHKMLWQAWGVEDAFNGDPEMWKLPAHRQRIADALTQARDLEARAIAEIEAALR